jgi:hypothetical protein
MRKSVKYFAASHFAVAALVTIAASTALRAEEPLRWKFKVGEKLDYNMVQEMTMAAAGGGVGQAGTTMRQEMDMVWDVQGVNDQGEAVIRQKFDRVKMKMTTPLGGFEYDSKSETAPTGFGAMIAPMYKAMTKGDFEITMTSRGEVKEVKIPDEVLTALKNTPAAQQMGDLATADGFKTMIKQGALVLPDKDPKVGETWTTKVEVKNPAVGKQTVETTYKYDGTKDIDGVTYAVIKPQLKMDFENQGDKAEGDAEKKDEKQPQQAQTKLPQIQMKIAEQSSDGEVLFNVKEGRLHTTTLSQKVTINATAAGQTTQLKIDQKIDVKVAPAGEKKEGEAKDQKAAAEKTK